MYEEYYGFLEKPFSLTPDPKFLFKSESHASAFELLQYAIRRREGFIVVTGDIGTGKTTVCRALLERIDRKTFTALVLNPFLSEEELLKLILQDFGIVSREDVRSGRLAGISKQDLIDTLYDFLLGLLPLEAGAVLIIDEAQNLPVQVLEQIRILSNLETDKAKLLQVVLVGQLNLPQLLRKPEMRQLDQRVSIRCELKPLNREEVAAYVAHRLAIAGGSASVTFMPKALQIVHRLSGGIPRLINLICDRALIAGFAARSNRITPEMIKRAASSLELQPGAHSFRSGLAWLAGIARFARPGRRAAAVVFLAVAGLALALSPVRDALRQITVVGQAFRLASRAGPVAGSPTPSTPAAPVVTSRPLSGWTVLPDVSPAPVGTTLAGAAVESGPLARSSGVIPEGRRLPNNRRYTVLVASFPISEGGSEAGASAPAQLAALTARLEALGYPVYFADVDLGERGRWRRLLVGAYQHLDEARRDEARLRMMREFGEARAVTSAFATAAPRSDPG